MQNASIYSDYVVKVISQSWFLFDQQLGRIEFPPTYPAVPELSHRLNLPLYLEF